MLNFVWGFLILISLIVASINGRIEAITNAIMTSSGETIKIFMVLMGITCLWSGIMKIASKSGIVDAFTVLLRPITKKLFPTLKTNYEVMNLIIMNIVANILGMSNAATPLGLKAMKELDRLNGETETASDEMCLFVIMNTACLQIIPTTIIAMRKSFGSTQPFSIILPSLISSLLSVSMAVLSAKLLSNLSMLRFSKIRIKKLNYRELTPKLGDNS